MKLHELTLYTEHTIKQFPLQLTKYSHSIQSDTDIFLAQKINLLSFFFQTNFIHIKMEEKYIDDVLRLTANQNSQMTCKSNF